MKTNLLCCKITLLLLLLTVVSCNKDKIPSHPRILLLNGEETEIQKSIASDEIWDNMHQFILDECDEICDLPPVKRELIGRRLLDKSRTALNNYVHNTLTVNGKHQLVDGFAPVISYSGQKGMLNAVTDITAVYHEDLKSATRGIAIIDDQYVVVRDELETNANATTIRWNMLTSAEVKITDTIIECTLRKKFAYFITYTNQIRLSLHNKI